MKDMVQIHYTVPLKDKKIMDKYTHDIHTTNSKFLRKIFNRGILEAKAKILSKRLDKKLAQKPVNEKIKNDKDFNRWLLK